MNIQYVNPGFDAMIDSMMQFQTEDEAAYWSDSIFYFYPFLDKAHFKELGFAEKKRYLTDRLKQFYDEKVPLLNEKVEAYKAHRQKCRPQVEAAFTDAFGLDCREVFNDLRAEICLNPVSPRFLQERHFEIFYLNSENGAIGVSLHELVHFVWFYVWNQLFGDSYDEYERPGLKWILSEMVVECIMRDERLSAINPYFPREKGGCVYGYFQDMKIGERMALEEIEALYQKHDMQAFMRDGYQYCKDHEAAIRAHIAEAEKQFHGI